VGKKRARDQDARVSGRAQRRIASEQAQQRRRLAMIGGIVAALAIVAVLAFVLTRDDEDDVAPVLIAPANTSAPIDGRVAGDPDATVHVVEWGDYQ
jgi:hypothetical protein